MTDPAPLPLATPPGWYPEPGTRRPRWWDGIQWAFYAPEDAPSAATGSAESTPTDPYSGVAYPTRQAHASNAMATASLVLGLVGLVLCTLIVPSILAIIFGAIGVHNANQRGGRGKTMAVWGMVLGAIAVSFAVLVISANF